MSLLGHPYSYGPVITRLEILTSNWAKLLLARWRVGSMYTNNSTLATCNASDEEEIVNGIKGALTRQKWNFQCQISNVHKLTDLSQTFQKLEKLAEAVVKAKYGPLQRPVGYETSHV